MQSRLFTGLALCGVAAASANVIPRQTAAPSTTASSAPEVTAISSCHFHGSQMFCMAGTTEFQVKTTPTQTTDIPAQFTGCHHHGSEMYCIGPTGDDVEVDPMTDEGTAGGDHDHDHDGGGNSTGGSSGGSSDNKHCHFHAGVEHCVGDGESEGGGKPQCDKVSRDYNVPLRVGLLFAILATSALGVFGPILLTKFLPNKLNVAFTILKQFGTGIIISTAFVHLYTHASLMLGNKCLGDLGYEAVTSAIVMAGIFLSFLVEFVGHRIVLAKTRSTASMSPADRARAMLSSEVVSILVMEAGILFHSLLIGLTLVVAGDSVFLTLFVVIVFHQIFEGLALGSRIATIGTAADTQVAHGHCGGFNNGSGSKDADKTTSSPTEEAMRISSSDGDSDRVGLSMKKKLGLASLFAFITPIGMAIGIGVLHKFNGNDRSTLLAIGTLDALSAGILVWVGLVEMWAADWMTGAHGKKAELADANLLTVGLAGAALIAGMALMSLLGKWA
ncbi:Zinc/iron permease [Purpureocillium lavendulum]|uniref:Zinc/iron permease n=1 Tax=Purpureocillium lavendulum TaxID=1247861 RepID=A0AB34FPU7_9HYPO|nr:Zinc/iron permease [Purpureocillium lavendulum]